MAVTDYRSLPDDELVSAFQRGERVAFEVLVRRHHDRVFGICVRMLGSPQWAEEAAQEVFVRVFRSLHRFRGESRFTTWLYQVAINHCRNVQAFRGRRQERRHDSLDAEREDEDGSTHKRQLADDRPDAEAELLLHQRLELVQEELARLDPLWKEILVLRDVEGLSYEEIGQTLELSPGTVKSRIFRARAQLRERIERRQLAGSAPTRG